MSPGEGASHAARRFLARHRPLMITALVAIAMAYTADALGIFWREMPNRDFGAFYSSGRAWNEGEPIYAAGRADLPNLNPPGVVAAIFSPMARLPLHAAGILWQLAGAAALGFSAWRIARGLAAPANRILGWLAIGLLTVSARYAWLEGQITWLLLLPATEAWLAYRRRALALAGAWLGIVIAVKPFFALTGIALGMTTAAAAAAVSVTLTAGGVIITTGASWRDWLALGPGISVTWPSSASLWTLGTRWTGATPLDTVSWTDLPAGVIAALAVIGAAAIYLTVRLRNRDARWAAAIALALLVSPLGWIYYLPLAFGSLAALRVHRRWSGLLTAAVIAACIPLNLHFWAIDRSWLLGVTLGAAYTWGMLLLISGTLMADNPRHDTPDGSP